MLVPSLLANTAVLCRVTFFRGRWPARPSTSGLQASSSGATTSGRPASSSRATTSCRLSLSSNATSLLLRREHMRPAGAVLQREHLRLTRLVLWCAPCSRAVCAQSLPLPSRQCSSSRRCRPAFSRRLAVVLWPGDRSARGINNITYTKLKLKES